MNDRAKYKGRMAIYAMAGVYLLAQAYYMYKDIPTSSGTDKTLMSIFMVVFAVIGAGMVIMGVTKSYKAIKEDYNAFKNIVIKRFDWENYIYKAILIAQYVEENTLSYKHEYYYRLILQNMDMFNYIIKYEIFRNGQFLINIMDIIAETNLGPVLKAKIKNRPDLGKDERYGRRVIFELNKAYPIVMSPMLDKEMLKEYFLKYLGYYYDGNVEIDTEEILEEF